MSWLSLIRVLKMGLKNFWRNIWLSIATTGIMVLTIFSVALLVILNIIGDTALRSLEQKIDVSIYFKTEIAEDEIRPILRKLESMEEVREAVFVPKEEALESFKEKHSDKPLIIASLNELDENPLQPTVVVKARSPNDFASIAEVLQEDKYQDLVEDFNYEDNRAIIDRLTNATNTVEKVGIGLSIGFAIISVLVMFNTVRLTMYTQKEEIGIMRLVGASNMFITAPYIIEGLLYGFFATIISTGILYILLGYLQPIINRFLEYQADIFAYFGENFFIVIAAELLFGAALGVLSSMIAIRRYLKV